MTVYLIAQIEINDRSRYSEYEAGFMAIFERFGGRVMSVDEQPTVMEGDWPYTRTVLIEFPDAAAANSWYNSPDYQQLAQHRMAASSANLVMINELTEPL